MSTPNPQGEDGRPLTRREMRELAERQIVEHAQGQPNPAAQPAAFPTQPAPQMPPVAQTQRPSAPAVHNPVPGLQAQPIAQPVQQPVQVSRRSMHQVPQGPRIPQVTPPSQAGAVRVLEETGTISNLVDPATFEPNHEPVSMTLPHGSRVNRVNAFEQQDPHPAQNGRSNLSGFMRQAPPSSQIPRVVQDSQGNWTAAPASVQEQFENQNAVLPSWGDPQSSFSGFSAATSGPSANFTPERADAGHGLPARNSAFGSQNPNSLTQSPAAPSFGQPQVGQTFSPTPQQSFASQQGSTVQQGSAPQERPLSGSPFGATPFGTSQSAAPSSTAPSLAAPSAVVPQEGVPTFSHVPERTSGYVQAASQANESSRENSGLPTAAIPAWDAITSVNSSLPQDPTLAGISAASLTGEIAPVRSTPAMGAGLTGPGLTGPGPMGAGLVGAEPIMPAHSPSAPGTPLPATPGMFSPVSGTALPAGESENLAGSFTPTQNLDHDLGPEGDEDFELDHSYTWLQYMILIAVAFVLGMIIWKVGIDPDRSGDKSPEDASSHSVVVEDPNQPNI